MAQQLLCWSFITYLSLKRPVETLVPPLAQAPPLPQARLRPKWLSLLTSERKAIAFSLNAQAPPAISRASLRSDIASSPSTQMTKVIAECPAGQIRQTRNCHHFSSQGRKALPSLPKVSDSIFRWPTAAPGREVIAVFGPGLDSRSLD